MSPAGGSGSAAVLLPGAAGWTLNKTVDRVETTAHGDANKTYVQGLPDVSGDFTVVLETTDDTYFDASESTNGCNIYLYPDYVNTPTLYHYGPAWVDASISTDISSRVEVKGTFGANGSWGRKP